MKKILAASLTAALALSIAPVASAQSSLSSLSSSSTETGTGNVSKVQRVEDNFAKVMQAAGHTSHVQHDQAADAAVQDAINGNVLFVPSPESNIPGFAVGQSISAGYVNLYYRFPLDHIDQVLHNIDNGSVFASTPEASVPFGVAVDESQSLVYVATTVHLSVLY